MPTFIESLRRASKDRLYARRLAPGLFRVSSKRTRFRKEPPYTVRLENHHWECNCQWGETTQCAGQMCKHAARAIAREAELLGVRLPR